MQPRVSVVIPVYNVAPYLTECLDSVCRQTYPNLDILVIDDGSTDGSSQICDAYASKDSRIRVYHKENGGLSDARNYGLDRALGEYVTFIDSDDRVTEDYVACLMTAALKYDVPFVLATFSYLTKDGLKPSYSFPYDEGLMSERDYLHRLYGSKTMPTGALFNISWGKLFDRRLFRDIRFPVGKLHEDVFTTYKLAIEAGQILCLNAFIYHYRLRENSIMSSPYSLSRLDILEGMAERITYLEERGYDLLGTEKNLLKHYRDNCVSLRISGYSQEYKKFRQEYATFLKKMKGRLPRFTWIYYCIQYHSLWVDVWKRRLKGFIKPLIRKSSIG
ncbi:glycosyltransferase family 2 protein [Streptococcus suis]|uniref:glycosyltransferase family 2 protein n=1 Tax=Streptococcus suis TaxID=1307 RepID=UPI001ABE1425|nr:glycosyltransferase family 2 protein [Streptococcus suis]MBO4127285.1 glycosyltransferase family 2 protein [Streptococcus suis]WFA75457.1 glycosyltransferase family 2 protein [Streptococcus suis]